VGIGRSRLNIPVNTTGETGQETFEFFKGVLPFEITFTVALAKLVEAGFQFQPGQDPGNAQKNEPGAY